jgi:hypothetical protein
MGRPAPWAGRRGQLLRMRAESSSRAKTWVSEKRRPTLAEYLRVRLGREGGVAAWFNFFVRPFGAPSFAGFWRRWNPVYGYFLYYDAFRPLSRFLPRGLAVLATFAACGLVLHDLPAWVVVGRVLPPGGTLVFVLFGLGAVLGEALGMDLSRRPVPARAAVNAAYLAACSAVMLVLILRLVA